jgi:polyhydroxyalkanoate synthesis regulator phasin
MKARNIISQAKQEKIELEFDCNIRTEEPKSYKDIVFERNELEYTQNEVKNLEKKYKELWETESKLRALDYIGVKIATGRATIEEYAEEIAEMSRLADKVNQLRAEIKELENEKLD